MVVATVSSDGRPFTGPVDAFLHHGRVHFGTAAFADRLRRHYGCDWDEWGAGSVYYAVEPDRALAADMSVHLADANEQA